MLNLAMSTQAAEVYQALNFSVTCNAGDYAGLAVQDTKFFYPIRLFGKMQNLLLIITTILTRIQKVPCNSPLPPMNQVDFRGI